MNNKYNKIAVAIIHHKSIDNEHEELSVSHAKKFFKDYDVYSVTPSGVEILNEFRKIHFEDKFFANYVDNNYLRLLPKFYEKFSNYQFLLIYELDSLVFADNAIDFCSDQYDYIGAPWVRYLDNGSIEFIGVGNSGFSIRNIESCLKVTTSDVLVNTPSSYWQNIGRTRTGLNKLISLVGCVSKLVPYRNNIDWFSKRFIYGPKRVLAPHEDKFWHIHARHFNPDFKFAPLMRALEFSFEHAPQFCFENNNRQLPLGCHAWFKYDKDFWLPHLLRGKC